MPVEVATFIRAGEKEDRREKATHWREGFLNLHVRGW